MFWESAAKHSKLFKWRFGDRKLLRQLFWSYLDPKIECSELLKRTFFSFLQVFEWRSWNQFLRKWGKAFNSKLFKTKFGHRKLLTKIFSRYLELRNECSEHWKIAFFQFLKVFEWQSWNHFLGKWSKAPKTISKKNMVIGSFLKMVLKLSWAKKHIFWAFEKNIFQFFASFWVTKLKPFSGKLRQNVQNYLNLNLVMRSFLEKGFEATLSSKANVLSVWKDHFFSFLQLFEWRSWNSFLGKSGKAVRQNVQNYLN